MSCDANSFKIVVFSSCPNVMVAYVQATGVPIAVPDNYNQ